MKRFQLLAWNTAERLLATCFASNEIMQDGEWLRISPYGDFPNKAGLQRVQKEDAEQIVTAFNSFKGQISRGFMGLPIYVGHPDVAPKEYADKRRYGRINELQAREDGLYGLVAMNDLGKQALEQGHYLYNSPTWYLRKDGVHIRPMQLVSVGLTNNPQIPNEPWAQNEDPKTPTPDTNMDWLKQLLMDAGLIKEGDTEDAMKAAVTAALAQLADAQAAKTAADAAAATAANERDGLRTQLVAANERFSKLALDGALTAGRITAAQRAEWEAKFKTDPIVASNELSQVKVTVPTKSKVAELGQRKTGESNQASEKIVAINEAVANFAKEAGLDLATNEGHNAAWNGAKKKSPELFK